jgi:hippurate hydrolase
MTVDPVVQAAQLVLALQTIVSREIKPTESAVVTVGSIHAGTKHNVISDQCHLQLTVRSYSDETRKHLLQAIQRKAAGVAAGAGAPDPIVKFTEGTPSVWNDRQLAERLDPVFRRALGEENVSIAEPSMGGEDFSRYGRAGIPALIFWLGSVDSKRLAQYGQRKELPPSLHSPLYYPDYQQTLVTGITAMASAALELLAPGER